MLESIDKLSVPNRHKGPHFQIKALFLMFLRNGCHSKVNVLFSLHDGDQHQTKSRQKPKTSSDI